ncbi:MAG: RNA polymerase sigma factor [Planctomycetales bacterium]|nr:RNA polymerase sigma factor [Planctomycetales bacterium]
MLKQHTEELGQVASSEAKGLEVKKLSDEQLLHEYRRTESAGVFAELVSRYERELYNYLKRFLADAAMAEDVFQATFLQVHLKCEMFESGRKFRPWLYTIATNQAIDAQRRNRRHRRLSLDEGRQADGETGSLMDVLVNRESGPYEAVEGREWAEWIREAVAGLPDPLQHAVKLVYFRGMKYREAAKVLSVPVGTVKSRLHAAIRRLSQSTRESRVVSRS